MKHRAQMTIATGGRGLYNLDERIESFLRRHPVKSGDLDLFCRHTSCSLIIGENADPSVLVDLDAFFERLVPDGDSIFTHRAEGPDDMPAHIRSVLTQTQLRIPVEDGRLATGTWQGVFLWEHRHHQHNRSVWLTLHDFG